jgi:outer membrane receptor protein involved in Fe transport
LDVSNLTNKLYYFNMANSLRSFGFLTGEPAEPRTAFVRLKYSWQ